MAISARQYANLTDEQLAKMAQEGDRRAMEVLVQRYEPLRAAELRRWGAPFREDRAALADLASEILAGFIDLIHGFDSSRGVRVAGWLKRTVWTKARDAAEKMIDEWDAGTLDDDLQGGAEPVATGASLVAPSPDAGARYAHLMDKLQSAMDPLEFRIFELWFWDRSYAEIGSLLGLTLGQVRNAMSREKPPGILQIARKVLSEHGYA